MKDNFNIILATDTYKFASHWKMLRKLGNVERISAYGECRTGGLYPITLFFGLQAIIKQRFVGRVVEQWMIDEAKEIAKCHVGDENAIHIEGWQTIVDEFDGHLPISIRAVAEGSLVPLSNVLFTVTDTDEKKRFAWLSNYIESILMKVWYPCTVATRSYTIVKFLKEKIEQTSDIEGFHKFMLHDFGYRSTEVEEASAIGGAAHLINSLGTDTVPALKFAKEFYGADYETLAYSVPASEHQISTLFGNGEGQTRYIEDLMEEFPDAILSLVSDTYGIEEFIGEVVPKSKAKILARRANSKHPLTKLVFRPDSLRSDDDTPVAQMLWILNSLADTFGFTINSKGFKVLNPAIGTLWGDGLSEAQIFELYDGIIAEGWSAENIVSGQGGGLLQKLNRDTQRFAIKASAALRDGVWVPLQKKPTEAGKASKAGRLKLVKMQKNPLDISDGLEYNTINEFHPLYHDFTDQLVEVYRNGKLLVDQTFAEIRARANA